VAITGQGVGTLGSGDDTISPGKPSGTTTGDLLLSHVIWVGGPTSLDSVPSGWTIVQQNSRNGYRNALVFKIAGGSEPGSYTFTANGASMAARVFIFRGVDPFDPLHDSIEYESGLTGSEIETHSIDLPAPESLLICCGTVSATGSWNPPAGFLEVIEVATPSSSGSCFEERRGPGASGVDSMDCPTASTRLGISASFWPLRIAGQAALSAQSGLTVIGRTGPNASSAISAQSNMVAKPLTNAANLSAQGVMTVGVVQSLAFYDDYTPASGVDYEYRVLVHGINGTVVWSAWVS